MASWILLMFSMRLVSALPEFQGIVEQLLRTTHFVLPPMNSIPIFHGTVISTTSETLLDRFLQLSTDPVIISNRLSNPGSIQTPYSIIFVGEMNPVVRRVIDSEQRMVIVTTDDVFPTVLKECISGRCPNAVHFIYNETSALIYHYNKFLEKLDRWEELRADPIGLATNDLAGLRFYQSFERVSDANFVVTIVWKLNGSLVHEHLSDFSFSFVDIMEIELYMTLKKLLYMYRFDYNQILVPRMNKLIPAVYILTDPFSVEIWLLNLATIISLAMFRTYLSKQRTIQQILQSFLNLVGSVTIGQTIQPFRRELERQLIGLFLLFYIVLVSCYQSLVISYLLSPRFYPELNTMQQLNESCCWDRSPAIEEYNYQRYCECASGFGYKVVIGVDAESVQQAQSWSLCIPVDIYMQRMIEKDSSRTVRWEFYRWAKSNWKEWPMMAAVYGDSVLAEKVQLLSGVYYSEGGLYKRFERIYVDRKGNSDPKRVELKDLSLVWVVFGVGMVCGMITFSVESVIHFISSTRILLE